MRRANLEFSLPAELESDLGLGSRFVAQSAARLITALLFAGCMLTFSAANASESEPLDATEKNTKTSATETDPAFRLHAESKERKRPRGMAIKALTRSLMYPISSRTRENKTTETPSASTRSLSASTAAQSLAEFDLELIVDESKSMLRTDCPGGVSRWDWCAEQLSDLSRQLSPYVQRGFTLTTFSSDYQVLKNATADDVTARFDKHPSADGTRLSLPLNGRFKQLLENRTADSRPILLVIITDGMPHPRSEPSQVIDALIDATKRIKDDKELTVAVLQIGHESEEGKAFVKEIDDDLVKRGARYDIVRSVPFEALERVGLVNTLVGLVRNFAGEPTKETSKTSN